MNRLETPKRPFKFTIEATGKSYTINTVDDLENVEEEDYKSKVKEIYFNHLEKEKYYEREWRNYELTNTDWMLLEDATYAGDLLKDSTYLEDIIIYRSALRAYNLTTDDRPNRPDWFKD